MRAPMTKATIRGFGEVEDRPAVEVYTQPNQRRTDARSPARKDSRESKPRLTHDPRLTAAPPFARVKMIVSHLVYILGGEAKPRGTKSPLRSVENLPKVMP